MTNMQQLMFVASPRAISRVSGGDPYKASTPNAATVYHYGGKLSKWRLAEDRKCVGEAVVLPPNHFHWGDLHSLCPQPIGGTSPRWPCGIVRNLCAILSGTIFVGDRVKQGEMHLIVPTNRVTAVELVSESLKS